MLKQHKINVTMTKNDRQEKRGRQGVRVLLEIGGEGGGIGYWVIGSGYWVSGIGYQGLGDGIRTVEPRQ